MHTTPTLAARFARNTFVVRSETPLAEDQMRQAAPSIFAAGKHDSRSERYTYIPTRSPARPAQGGFRAFHGGAGQEPHRRQGRVHEAHDPYGPRGPRGQLDAGGGTSRRISACMSSSTARTSKLVVSVAPTQEGHLYVRPLVGGPRRVAPASALKLRGFVGR